MKKTILFLGATSPVARAAAHCWARKGYPIYLASRDTLELERIASDIRIKWGVPVYYRAFEAEEHEQHLSFLKEVLKEAGSLGGALLAFSKQEDHGTAILNFAVSRRILETNLIGACSILTHLANMFGCQGEGFIAATTSIEGLRGRQSDYVLGAAKGGLTIFLQGLRNRLFHSGVHVLTVHLGPNEGNISLGAKTGRPPIGAHTAGHRIFRAVEKKKNVIYTPHSWRYLSIGLRLLPESLFKRLKL